MTEAMAVYGMVFAKLAIGLLAIILQINLMGKGNLAPTSALDQLQNYVLGGIIGAIIYNDQIGILQFMLVLILWTILVMSLKFLKGNLRFFKTILDGHPVIVIEKDREWLEQEVQAQGYSIKDVYIAEYNGGKVVIYPYERKKRSKF